ncbi:MAG TPA: hypothetical protein VII73_11365 [Caulobacteraceae bacterium]
MNGAAVDFIVTIRGAEGTLEGFPFVVKTNPANTAWQLIGPTNIPPDQGVKFTIDRIRGDFIMQSKEGETIASSARGGPGGGCMVAKPKF